jgi:hypothetical protein
MKRLGGEMLQGVLTTVALALLLVFSSEAKGAPAKSLRELYSALGECVKGPVGLPGSEITIVFSLKRNGSLLGKPRISNAKLLGDTNAQKDFVASVLAGFDRCLPVNITDGLGGVVAGRPMRFRVINRPRRIET